MTSSQPTQPLTDEDLEDIREHVESGRQVRRIDMQDLITEVDRLRAENTAQAKRIAAAAELHRPTTVHGIVICECCLESESAIYGKTFEVWPCATARALGLDQDGEGQANA